MPASRYMSCTTVPSFQPSPVLQLTLSPTAKRRDFCFFSGANLHSAKDFLSSAALALAADLGLTLAAATLGLALAAADLGLTLAADLSLTVAAATLGLALAAAALGLALAATLGLARRGAARRRREGEPG